MFNFSKKKSQGAEAIFNIKGMHCPSCAMNIDFALEEIDGVLSSKTSYAKAQVEIEYDDKKVSKEQLVKAIANEGYLVTQNFH
ncbi:MAG: hypothetical protein UT13_C0001G0780 [Candidatus Pacebacteria bacterium GW2011_GWF2_38_9]|nr:MAG: heavy metal binding protein [candidate division TM6 bacterium GW2011_GWF2_28_16]KKQ08837.1 MAG: hypothetical protein US20_C0011G0006 [Candidatus Pacebacteria bacterium GW2011_GWF1_36_5]KKQ89132.1 MAG: hypothetical protein UT13_C0001G0780 [Candidatus Pacebacteria bacterium GW2011_GWF2_38_9]HAZ73632.1 heavy metal transporter [Candidatus Paceibacterota bacterium]